MSVELSVDLLVDPFGSAYPFEVPVDPSWSPEPTADEVAVLAELARLFPPDPHRPVHRDDLAPWDRDDLDDVPAADAYDAGAEVIAAAERPDGCGPRTSPCWSRPIRRRWTTRWPGSRT